MLCKKCGSLSAGVDSFGECPTCSSYIIPRRTQMGEPVKPLPPPQPTLRDLWAIAIFRERAVWADTDHEIREAYRAADFALQVRDEK